MIILGLNSGTSRDGVSGALFETRELLPSAQIRLILSREYPYPRQALELLDELGKNPGLEKLARANFFIGELFASAALKLIKESRVKKNSIDIIASHGQTVGHFPEAKKMGRYQVRASLQIGEPAMIAHRTGITTVADFRPAEIAAGGQGAPVLVYPEYLLFASGKKNRMVINLGGIANFSLIPKSRGPEKVWATDAGPCNLLLDELIRLSSRGALKFDPGGEIALKGRARQEWSRAFLRHKFFSRPPPKTGGREDFNREWMGKILSRLNFRFGKDGPDLVRSGARAVAEMIAQCYSKKPKDFALDEVIVSGGGAKNKALLLEIEQALGRKPALSEVFGIPLQAKEPIGFGLLGELCIRGLIGNRSLSTGGGRDAILGKICPGKNWRLVLKKIKAEKAGRG